MSTAKHYLILGGRRSGKSSYAAQLALELTATPLYIATARKDPNDVEFTQRIKKHIASRGKNWTTIEEEKYLSKIKLDQKVAVIDCITLWLTNFFMDNQQDVDQTWFEAQQELDQLICSDNRTIIMVANEVGMSIHHHTATGSKFADLQGIVNQYLAKKVDKVILMVAGIPVEIK